MRSKIYSSGFIKATSRGRKWIPALGLIGFLLIFPVTALIKFGIWFDLEYTGEQIEQLYRELWTKDFLILGAWVSVMIAFFNGISGFWYLYSSRKTDFYHSLPVKRSDLFWHRVLVGLLYYVVPYAIMEFAAVCVGAMRGFFSLTYIKFGAELLILHLFMYFLVYFTVVLLIGITGNILMGGLSFIGVLFYFPLLAVLIQGYGEVFFKNWFNGDYGVLKILKYYGAPEMIILSCMKENNRTAVLVLIISTLILVGLSWIAYVKRRSEDTGKAYVYPWIMAVVDFMVTVGAGLGIGLLFYIMPEKSGRYPWWIFGMILGTLLTHGILEVIYGMDIRDFFSHRIRLVLAGAIIAVTAVSFNFDLVGYDAEIPAYESLKGISLSMDSFGEELPKVTGTETGYEIDQGYYPTSAERLDKSTVIKDRALYKIMKEIAGDKDNNKKAGSISVKYIKNSGCSIYRTYRITKDQVKKLLTECYNDPAYRKERCSALDINSTYLKNICCEYTDGSVVDIFRQNKMKQEKLLKALRKDMEDTKGEWVRELPCAMLELDFQNVPVIMKEEILKDVDNRETIQFNIRIYPAYQRTLAILKETGYPLSMDEVPIEYIDIHYLQDKGAVEEITDISKDSQREDEGSFIRYSEAQDIQKLKQCMRPAEFMDDWDSWRTDVTVEATLKSTTQETVYMKLTDSIPDFVQKAAEEAGVVEWEAGN